MEDLTDKLNKYIIKLNNLLDNEQINYDNYNRYLLYLKKVHYYYKLVGGVKKTAAEKVAEKTAKKQFFDLPIPNLAPSN